MGAPGRRVLGGRYELESLIASGGMGQVWRARDTLLGRTVAVKVLRSEYSDDPTFLARFRAEAQHTAALSHPNIAAVHDYGEQEDCGDGSPCAYLVMELVDGEPLSAVLHREGALEPEATLSVLRQTAAALAVAHASGVVHRDVKPGNILVTDDGTVKITDFGIAWSASSVPLTQTGQVVGTAHYLSPEQARGEHATPASDVYALGMVGYECLSGHKAFDGDNSVTIALKQLRQDPEPLPGELPPGVRTLVRRALLKDPRQRFADGAAFAAAVDDVRAGRPVSWHTVDEPEQTRLLDSGGSPDDVVPGSTAHRTPPRRVRRRVAAVLVPLLALLVGAGIAVAAVMALSDRDAGAPAVAASTQDEGSFVLHAEDFLGRPVDEVTEQLVALGLNVTRQQEVTSDATPGAVTGLDPAGGVMRRGDTVVVRWAARPPVPGVSGDDRTVTEAATEAATQAPTQAATGRGTTAAQSRTSSRGSAATRAATPSPTPTPSPTRQPDTGSAKSNAAGNAGGSGGSTGASDQRGSSRTGQSASTTDSQQTDPATSADQTTSDQSSTGSSDTTAPDGTTSSSRRVGNSGSDDSGNDGSRG